MSGIGGPRASGMRLLAQHDLDGHGNGGEGMALQLTADGRRLLYIAHESAPIDFSVLDVTDPRQPRLLLQRRLPHAEVRSNSLDLVDDLLLVAYQTLRPGMQPAGVGIYDVSDPAAPREVGFFDTSGPWSRGAHCLWFVDGRYAHVSTGAPDFQPRDQRDDQLYMILDVGEPAHPREVGRWWLPGTAEGDAAPPPERHPRFDVGFRVHNANVYPERPDRAYVGYIDGGVVILDIADLGAPRMVSRFDYHPPFPGFTHTVLPLFERELLIVSDEAVTDDCADHPKLVWVMDGRDERNPVPISTLPLPPPEEFCAHGGRFGAHNLHENRPGPTSWHSETRIVGSYFAAGVRVHDISDPFRPTEVASFVPGDGPDGTPISINDVHVDERGVVYAIDRRSAGLFMLELTN